MIWSGSATHLSNCTRLSFSKYPRSTRKIFLGQLDSVGQAHTTGRPSPDRCQIFFSRSVFEPLHLHQYFSPNWPLSSSISPISNVPLNTILVLPFRHFLCPQRLPPSNHRWHHQCNRPLTRDILRNQEEHRCPSFFETDQPKFSSL